MEPSLSTIVAVLAQLAAILAAGTLYLRQVRVERPPVGVFNGRDVAVVGAVLMLLPVVYVRLPGVVLGVVVAGLSTALLYFALAPLVRSRWAAGLAVALVAVDVALAVAARDSHPWLFNATNNLALAVMLVGVSNMWVQSGVRARHLAALAVVVAVFDAVATVGVSLMTELVARLATLPLTPMLIWGEGRAAVGLGLGDLLLILLWTLVTEKAYSRRAAAAAALLGVSCSLVLFLAFWLDLVNRPLPAMVLLGPVIAVHYRFLARGHTRERTAGEYFASLRPSRATTVPAQSGGRSQAWRPDAVSTRSA